MFRRANRRDAAAARGGTTRRPVSPSPGRSPQASSRSSAAGSSRTDRSRRARRRGCRPRLFGIVDVITGRARWRVGVGHRSSVAEVAKSVFNGRMSNSDKLSSAAAQAKAKADELIAKATPAVTEAAHKAGEYAVKAGEAAAGQVDGVAGKLKSLTSGKGADTIDKVGARLKKLLDPDHDADPGAEPARASNLRLISPPTASEPDSHGRDRPILGCRSAGCRTRGRILPGDDDCRAPVRAGRPSGAGQDRRDVELPGRRGAWRCRHRDQPGSVVDVLPPFAGG